MEPASHGVYQRHTEWVHVGPHGAPIGPQGGPIFGGVLGPPGAPKGPQGRGKPGEGIPGIFGKSRPARPGPTPARPLARPPAGLGKASGRPSQPFGFVFDANASPEFRPGAYASLTGPFIMALGPLGAGVYGPYGALGPLWQ